MPAAMRAVPLSRQEALVRIEAETSRWTWANAVGCCRRAPF